MARTFAVSVRRVPRGLAASRLDSAALRLGFSGRPLGVDARVVRRDAPDLLDSALMARTFAVSVRRVLRGLTASRALRLGAGAWVVG